MLPTVHTGKGLLRQFAILSLLVIGLVTLALSLTISHYLRKDLLEREWVTTADYVRTQILSHLTPGDLAAPKDDTAKVHFESLYQQVVSMPEIFRVKIYDSSMTVIWSDDPRLIGQRFSNNAHLEAALTGRTVVNLEPSGGKEENVSERNVFARVVEVYVPIVLPGASRVAGAVEVYKMPQQVFASIRKGQLTVVGTVLVCGLVLYLCLFWIVRRAARRIEEQHQALEHRSQELAVTNQELQTVQGQLLETERMAAIGEVVMAVAHGIRNPLANIRASAQVASMDLREGEAPALASRSLANIMAEVDRLEGRLKELLQFIRPAERSAGLLDLNVVLRGSIQLLSGRLANTRVKVDELLASDLPKIQGDAILLEEVFMSLIGNAVEALPGAEGAITLVTGTARDGAALRVFAEVRDTGVGIPPEEIPKVFQPFYTTKSRGTGLGLAIAKKFTEAHGGTIVVSSGPREGTKFRVTFPARSEA